MNILMTGFTTKSYTGLVPSNSKDMQDLSSVLPIALRSMGHSVHYHPSNLAMPNFYCVFVKLWDINDPTYSTHSIELLNKLEIFIKRGTKIFLINDHWDFRPAGNSLMESKNLTAAHLFTLAGTQGIMLNTYGGVSNNGVDTFFDPSPYVIDHFNLDRRFKYRQHSSPRRWVYATLSRPFEDHDNVRLPVRSYTTLKQHELITEIGKQGLLYMTSHPSTSPYWWRPNYLFAAYTGAAVYSSKEEQLALYGFYVDPNTVEKYPVEVHKMQSSELISRIWSKEKFNKKLAELLG